MSSTDFVIWSNLSALLAISYAFSLGEFHATGLTSISMIISIMYHYCQTGRGCIATPKACYNDYTFWQWADEFFVFLLIIFYIAYTLKLTRGGRNSFWVVFFFIVSLPFIFLTLIFNINFWICELVLILVGLGLFVVSFLYQKKKFAALLSLLVAIGLVIGGFIVFYFGGNPGDSRYETLHGIWHILIYLAAFFLLDVPYGNFKRLYYRIFSKKRKHTRFRHTWFKWWSHTENTKEEEMTESLKRQK